MDSTLNPSQLASYQSKMGSDTASPGSTNSSKSYGSVLTPQQIQDYKSKLGVVSTDKSSVNSSWDSYDAKIKSKVDENKTVDTSNMPGMRKINPNDNSQNPSNTEFLDTKTGKYIPSDQADYGTKIKATGKELARTFLDPAAKFIGSAVQSPVDIVRSLTGKEPLDTTLHLPSGGNTKSIQSEFADKKEQVEAGKMSPVDATVSTVGDTVSGAGDVLGLGEGAGAALDKGVDVTTKAISNIGKDASSVISYIDSNGQKVFTRLTPDELGVLKNEVKNIPQQTQGVSQIHLDPANPQTLNGAKEVSRDEFINGHPQAKEVFDTASPVDKKALSRVTPDFENMTPKQKVDMAGEKGVNGQPRVNEGGALKGRTINNTQSEIDAAKELQKIKGYDNGLSNLETHNLIQNEISKEAKSMRSSLANEKIAVPKREIVSTVKKAVDLAANDSLLLNKTDPIVDNYMRVAERAANQSSGTAEGILDTRQALDDAYYNARGKMAYGDARINSLDEIHKSSRNALNDMLDKYSKATDVKASLKKQSNLYNADDTVLSKVGKEPSTGVGRNKIVQMAKDHPFVTGAITAGASDKIIKATTGFGI